MSNFVLFQCNTCNRKTEQLINQTHATLTKCNITYKCTGTLIKIGESDTKTLSGSDSKSQILTSWVPRGTTTQQGTQQSSGQVPINSALGILSIAADATKTNAINSFNMSVEIKRITNSSFVEYFYNRTANTTTVSGQDDSSKRLSLRFVNGSTPDALVVYVNGVEIDKSQYDRTVPGRLVFNPALSSETNLIRIMVYQQVAATYKTLTFKKSNTVFPTASAWDNVSKVEQPRGTSYNIFTCADLSLIPINTQMVIKSVSYAGETTYDGMGYLLRADAPFSNYDRDQLNTVLLKTMIDGQEVIEFKNDDKNVPKYFVNSVVPVSLFPPLSITTRLSADVVSSLKNDSDTKLSNLYIT